MTRFLWGVIAIVALTACENGPEPAVTSPEGGDKVTMVRLSSSNVYFIQAEHGYVMVDAGMDAREEAVEELFSRAGIEQRDVSLIIVTHGVGWEGAELSLGRFYVDEELALRNLESVVSAMPRLIHLSHGTSTDASNLSGFIGVQSGVP